MILIFLKLKKIAIKFEVNNKNVALNILYVPFNTKKIEIAYKSKYNLIKDNQIILLIIAMVKIGIIELLKVYLGY